MTQQQQTGARGGFVSKPNLTERRNQMKYKVSTSSLTAKGVVPIRGATQYPAEPDIFFTREAWVKQCHLVQTCSKEVGWFALVDHNAEANSFTITELVIPNQEVTAAETDIGKEDLADAAMELIEAGKDTSKMYAWFHSHVNMGVTPSTQDEYQVEDFLEDLMDQPEIPAFIRGIQNKKGELKLDVYYVRHGVAYQNVDFYVIHDDDPQWLKDIEDEVKNKVTEKVYGYYGGSGGNRQAAGKSQFPARLGNEVGHGGGWGNANGLRNGGGYNGYNGAYDDDDDDIYDYTGYPGLHADNGGSNWSVRNSVGSEDLPDEPTPVIFTTAELYKMDIVYCSPDGVEVLLDKNGKLWVNDRYGECYDYEDYINCLGEIDGDTFLPQQKAAN